MDLSQFALKMAQRARALPDEVNKAKRGVANAILKGVAEVTPVDTGVAVSGWDVGLGGSAANRHDAHAPGYKGTTRQENINATITTGFQNISLAIPGQTIHISNAVEYIADLNRGTSRQAPAGFVETAILDAREVLKTAKVIVS